MLGNKKKTKASRVKIWLFSVTIIMTMVLGGFLGMGSMFTKNSKIETENMTMDNSTDNIFTGMSNKQPIAAAITAPFELYSNYLDWSDVGLEIIAAPEVPVCKFGADENKVELAVYGNTGFSSTHHLALFKLLAYEGWDLGYNPSYPTRIYIPYYTDSINPARYGPFSTQMWGDTDVLYYIQIYPTSSFDRDELDYVIVTD